MAPGLEARLSPAPSLLDSLAGACRNGREGTALVEREVGALELQLVLDHLLASSAYERSLAASLAEIRRAPTPALNAAAALVDAARASVRREIRILLARADELLRAASEAQVTLARYAEVNQSLYEELQEQEGCESLALTKRMPPAPVPPAP